MMAHIILCNGWSSQPASQPTVLYLQSYSSGVESLKQQKSVTADSILWVQSAQGWMIAVVLLTGELTSILLVVLRAGWIAESLTNFVFRLLQHSSLGLEGEGTPTEQKLSVRVKAGRTGRTPAIGSAGTARFALCLPSNYCFSSYYNMCVSFLF